MKAICVSDLHGNEKKYRKLCAFIKQKLPEAVFISGDLLPNYYITEPVEFISEFLNPLFSELKNDLDKHYPEIFIITGNDDAAVCSEHLSYLELKGLLIFANKMVIKRPGYTVLGYPYVPPTPFQLKDWEKYDISRFLPRGAVSPEEGIRTVEIPENIKKHSTIKDDLDELCFEVDDFNNTICMFHAPPNNTNLDKLNGKNIHGSSEIESVGSFAVRKFIEKNQPLLTIHGHIHESTEISGEWMDQIGKTICYNASHSGSELAVIEFDTACPENAARVLI